VIFKQLVVIINNEKMAMIKYNDDNKNDVNNDEMW
jgi:hypothetical protein